MTTDSKPTYTESVEALTGFDEIAIAKKFGAQFDDLQGSMNLRALVFIEQRRAGVDEKAAYDGVMSLPLRDVKDHFSAETDNEVDPDEPETAMGEGDSSADA
ncbi:MAG TPA: hypothetical protein VGF17_20840 [Phytomonospora sp.]